MKLKFPHKEGDSITIYKDWEKAENPIGTAKLIKRIRFGRTYILEEMMPETSQIVYSFEEWLVEWPYVPDEPFDWLGHAVQTVEKIRFVETIGVSNSKDDDEYEEETEKLFIDKFITFNEKEIF